MPAYGLIRVIKSVRYAPTVATWLAWATAERVDPALQAAVRGMEPS
jgi:hypothetical protein